MLVAWQFRCRVALVHSSNESCSPSTLLEFSFELMTTAIWTRERETRTARRIWRPHMTQRRRFHRHHRYVRGSHPALRWRSRFSLTILVEIRGCGNYLNDFLWGPVKPEPTHPLPTRGATYLTVEYHRTSWGLVYIEIVLIAPRHLCKSCRLNYSDRIKSFRHRLGPTSFPTDSNWFKNTFSLNAIRRIALNRSKNNQRYCYYLLSTL